MLKQFYRSARKKANPLILHGLALFFMGLFSMLGADITQGINQTINEGLRDRPAGEIKTTIVLENPKEGPHGAEVLSARINGKLLEPTGSGYSYRAVKMEPSRVLWIEISITKTGGTAVIIQTRKELSKKNLGEEIFVKLLINYRTQKVTVRD